MKIEPPAKYPEAEPQHDNSDVTLDILQILHRQRWIIIFCCSLGLVAGILYALLGTVWYKSTAKILVNPKSPSATTGNASDVLEEDILANHMEVLRSRKIVEGALTKDGLMDLASIQPFLSEVKGEDAADYVIKRLDIVKGGKGTAKAARSLNISFSHTDPHETQQILESVLIEYQHFIAGQLESVMQRASEFINEAKNEVEADLRAAEQEYVAARKAAPLLFQGTGSGNVYQDKYRRIEEELLNIDIEESALRTRLARVRETLDEMETSGRLTDHLDKLALIDSNSLERLGLFAGLQSNAANTPDFQAAQPARVAEAQTQYQHVLKLMSEKQRLERQFGPGHPLVQDTKAQIDLVKDFLAEKEEITSQGRGIGILSPEALLKAYIGFLNHDLATLRERKMELTILAKAAEEKAKTLIDFELQDTILQTKIERQEALFDGVVQQLYQLDTASGLSGYIYELLETPRLGIKSWPKLTWCSLGGLLLGMFFGIAVGIANDMRDGRFHSAADIEGFVRTPMLGRIGKVNSIRRGVEGLIATELTPDAEAIRMVRTLLLPNIRSGELKTLGMTSPLQGDGKSTVVSNLAVSFSQLGLSVLVIDADLRRPSIHRYFSSKRHNGLSDILGGDLDPIDAIQSTEVENVSIMPAGSQTAIPAELLQSQKFDQLLEWVRDRYDLVLIDLPPVLAVSDPLVVAPKVAGMITVLKAATVRRSEVMNTFRRLEATGAKLVGGVLNTFGASAAFSSDGGYFGYYRTSYTESGRSVERKVAGKNGKVAAVNGRVITSRAVDANGKSSAPRSKPLEKQRQTK